MNKVEYGSNGAIVFWRTAPAKRDETRAALKEVFGDGAQALCPSKDSPLRSLTRAMKEYGKRFQGNVLTRKSRGSVNLVEEARGAKAKGMNNAYKVLASCKVPRSSGALPAVWWERGESANPVGQDPVVGEGTLTQPPMEVADLYVREQKSLPSNAVGMLVRTVISDLLNGAKVRLEGGVWWVPEENLEKLNKFSEKLQACAPGASIYICQTVMDASTLSAIGDALRDEVSCIKTGVDGYLESGHDAPPRFTSSIEDTRKKLKRYEEALGSQFESVSKMLDEVETSSDQVSFVADAFAALGG